MTTANQPALEDWKFLKQALGSKPPKLNSSRELALLLRLWHSHDAYHAQWQKLPAAYGHVASRFLSLGVAPLAREVAEAGLTELRPLLKNNPDLAVNLRRTLGRALAKTDNTSAAQAILSKLRRQGCRDEETVGSLASTYKDQAFACAVHSEIWRKLLRKALHYYREAYEGHRRIWTGINVATLELLSGNPVVARAVAADVQAECAAGLKQLKKLSESDRYWHLATLGEAQLIAGELPAAGKSYAKAAQLAGNQFGMVQTTRRHAAWILQHGIDSGRFAPESLDSLDDWLPLPEVIVFAGHMIDAPGRSQPRFPPRLESPVRETLRDWLRARRRLIGFSSAASGADILFQEVLQELGGESRIILPYEKNEFVQDSVAPAGGNWRMRFERVVKNATQVITASPYRLANQGLAFHYANLFVQGWAIERAAQLGPDRPPPVGLVVWDGRPGDGPGGTASAVQQWQQGKLQVHQVNLAAATADSPRLPIVVNPPSRETPGDKQAAADQAQIMSVLFADVVNFSHLNDTQIMSFIEYLLGPIAAIVNRAACAPVTREDRGDGFKLVFDHVRAAGQCALDICDAVRAASGSAKWSALGLPQNLSLRIGLHAGPVSGYVHPLTRQQRYTGSHVVRAARLEPKTPPGEVYASEAFAALAQVHGVTEFRCQYVKQLQFAKTYGTFPTYVLRRQS